MVTKTPTRIAAIAALAATFLAAGGGRPAGDEAASPAASGEPSVVVPAGPGQARGSETGQTPQAAPAQSLLVASR